jgi:hypothetical protein
MANLTETAEALTDTKNCTIVIVVPSVLVIVLLALIIMSVLRHNTIRGLHV